MKMIALPVLILKNVLLSSAYIPQGCKKQVFFSKSKVVFFCLFLVSLFFCFVFCLFCF